MKRIAIFVLLVSFLSSLYPGETTAAVNKGYVFTAPKRLLAGETENGCLSLHNLELPAHVLLELLTPSSVTDEEVLASTSSVVKTESTETCLELSVPTTKHSHGRLRLKIKLEKDPDYVVESEKEVSIEHDSLITFVETDKPVYKPGQDVNIRVLMLKHNLKPWRKIISKIWIENPLEVRVAQWSNVSLEHGMVQLIFPLSVEPNLGTWRIKLEKIRSYPQLIHTTTFEVKKYVLPRFQVTVNSPGYVLADAENITWNICAKYSYGKPVKGTLLLKSTPEAPSWRRKLNLLEIQYETELDSPDGCTEFELSGAVLGLSNWKVAPNNIVLIANFTEAGTGVVETTISRTVVMHQALKLEFTPYTPKYFKLGLPYHGKLRVLHQGDTPAANQKIQVCLSLRAKDEWLRVKECRNYTSSSDGFVDFIVLPHGNITSLSFVATAVDYPMKYYSPDKRWRVFMEQPSAYVDINPWYSPSESYLEVARGYQPIVCGEKYSFNVMYTLPANTRYNESISFQYSINSKGDIFVSGHVKHRPNRDTILNYSEFRNLWGPVEPPPNKTDEGTIAHRFPLSVKITPSMAPLSELLLYYVRPDGEIVATTYTIEVGHCFENKVKTAWHTDMQSPGTSTQYHVEAASWSLCGISAVDKSTLFLAGNKANLVKTEQVFEQLKRFHPDAVMRSIWFSNHCRFRIPTDEYGQEIYHLPKPIESAVKKPFDWNLRRTRRNTRIYYGGINYVDAIQAFDDFGAVVMSDLVLETRPCPQFFANHGSFPMLNVGWRLQMMDPEIDEPDGMFKTVKTMPMAFPLLNFAVAAAAMGPELGYVDQLPDQAVTLRSYFPETWLWELVPTGKEGKVTIERMLPHTITDWVGHTVCISPTHGLGVAPPTTLTAFQPFFLDYSLPYSVKRGEMLRMKVSLFNYMQHSLPVKIKLEDAPGLDLHLTHAVASFCVEARDSIVYEYILRPRVLGEVNITVSASIDPDFAEPCGPDTLIFTRDVIVKPILILPEGFPVDTTKSAFICPRDFSDDSTIVWNLELPEDFVPGSGRAYVSLIGDILGPVFENLDKLVRLPMGCGEQNMVLFVPNIHVIGYLYALRIENSELKARAIKNLEKGYQRELSYRHPDGSYSAFGPGSFEKESSIWLTAFVVKSFAQARDVIHIDEKDLKLSVNWIVKKQLENGCFPLVGRIFHKDMKGGLQEDDSSSSALTAYILISLLQSNVPLTASLINNALYCLEKGMTNDNDSPYTAALSTYALALLEHPKANSSMKRLMDRATRHHDLLWWEDKTNPSLGLSIEMTAYAVLSLVKLGGDENMVEALKAVRWMSKQRNSEGGFTSTQDTVLGLEALAKYALAMNTNSTDLSVLVTAAGVDYIYRMHHENRMILTQIRLPVLPTVLEISAEGEGCALVQYNIKYNVGHATGSEAFDLSVAAASDAFVDECSMQRITICARYKMADEESNMALLEVGMISGYVPDRASLHALLQDPSTKVKRVEEDHDIATIYFDKLTGEKTCISFLVNRENVVDRLEPANVKLYDYYQQELTVSSSYKFAQTCSSADIIEEPGQPNSMPIELRGPTERQHDESTTSLNTVTLEQQDVYLEKSRRIINTSDDEKDSTCTENKEKIEEHISRPITRTTLSNEKENDSNGERKDEFMESKIFGEKTKNGDIATSLHHSDDNNIVTYHADTPQIESGSGLTPEESNVDSQKLRAENSEIFTKEDEDEETKFNPSFVVVNHELETPDGPEGPVPVYVKPDENLESSTSSNFQDHKIDVTISNSSLQDPERKRVTQQELETTESTAGKIEAEDSSTSTRNPMSCPMCADKLPADINEIYCTAGSVIKVAIRRLHKARLLLDLHPSQEVKRLRSTVEFVLPPGCHCSPLQSPGSLALLIKRDHFQTTGEYSKQTLDESFSLYGLPSIGGVPQKITEARSTCTTISV